MCALFETHTHNREGRVLHNEELYSSHGAMTEFLTLVYIIIQTKILLYKTMNRSTLQYGSDISGCHADLVRN